MKKLFLLLTYSSILFTGLVSANNFPPVAVIEHDVNRDFFFAGETIIFDGTESYDRDEGGSSIYSYMWTIDGAYYFPLRFPYPSAWPPGKAAER